MHVHNNESTDQRPNNQFDPSYKDQVSIISNAIGEVLVEAGIWHGHGGLTGPNCYLLIDDLKHHFIREKLKSQ